MITNISKKIKINLIDSFKSLTWVIMQLKIYSNNQQHRGKVYLHVQVLEQQQHFCQVLRPEDIWHFPDNSKNIVFTGYFSKTIKWKTQTERKKGDYIGFIDYFREFMSTRQSLLKNPHSNFIYNSTLQATSPLHNVTFQENFIQQGFSCDNVLQQLGHENWALCLKRLWVSSILILWRTIHSIDTYKDQFF